MSRPPLRPLLAVALLLGAALWFRLRHPPPNPPTGTIPTASAAAPLEPPRPVARAGAPHHPLADRIRNPEFDARSEVLAVDELVNLCLHALRQSPRRPLGANAEFTAVLTGTNSLGLAYLPPDHPAINAAGELCDRWGRPYLIHPVSAARVDVRSAGEDGRFFTPDDIAAREPPAQHP